MSIIQGNAITRNRKKGKIISIGNLKTGLGRERERKARKGLRRRNMIIYKCIRCMRLSGIIQEELNYLATDGRVLLAPKIFRAYVPSALAILWQSKIKGY